MGEARRGSTVSTGAFWSGAYRGEVLYELRCIIANACDILQQMWLETVTTKSFGAHMLGEDP